MAGQNCPGILNHSFSLNRSITQKTLKLSKTY